MNKKNVSVIIPNYNHAHFLESAIGCYLSQTCDPLEIIVVDDGSTDDSLSVIEKMSRTSPLIRLIALGENSGVNKAIMRGLSEARGDYVVFTAADDFVEKTFLEKSLNILGQYPQAGFSFCDPSQFVYESKALYRYPLLLSEEPIYLSPDKLSAVLKSYSFTFPSNAAVFNREFLIKAKGFIADLDLGADWFSCFVCAFRHGVCYIPEFLTTATARNDSFSARGLSDYGGQKRTFFKVLELLDSNFSDVKSYFKGASIVYEYSFRSVWWMIFSKQCYPYLSLCLMKRLLMRSFWNYCRSILSVHQRNNIRRMILKYKIEV